MTSDASPIVSPPQRASRYAQLAILVALVKPRTIVEVGTHRGDSAVAMCLEALRHRSRVHYTGFDVFDSRDEEFHRRAFNGKRAFARQVADERLKAIQIQFPSFTYELIEGETAETLHRRPRAADFAFIDGDHRVEVISRDYAALAKSRVVVFDDYYDAGTAPGDELTRSHGCNRAIAALDGVTILPLADSFPNTGPIRMAVKIRESRFGTWLRPLFAGKC